MMDYLKMTIASLAGSVSVLSACLLLVACSDEQSPAASTLDARPTLNVVTDAAGIDAAGIDDSPLLLGHIIDGFMQPQLLEVRSTGVTSSAPITPSQFYLNDAPAFVAQSKVSATGGVLYELYDDVWRQSPVRDVLHVRADGEAKVLQGRGRVHAMSADGSLVFLNQPGQSLTLEKLDGTLWPNGTTSRQIVPEGSAPTSIAGAVFMKTRFIFSTVDSTTRSVRLFSVPIEGEALAQHIEWPLAATPQHSQMWTYLSADRSTALLALQSAVDWEAAVPVNLAGFSREDIVDDLQTVYAFSDTSNELTKLSAGGEDALHFYQTTKIAGGRFGNSPIWDMVVPGGVHTSGGCSAGGLNPTLAISPSGQRIAYVVEKLDVLPEGAPEPLYPPTSHPELVVVNSDGSNRQSISATLSDRPCLGGLFWRDDDNILFWRRPVGQANLGEQNAASSWNALFNHNVSSGALRVLTATENESDKLAAAAVHMGTLTPDGRTILAGLGSDGPTSFLASISLDDLSIVSLITRPFAVWFGASIFFEDYPTSMQSRYLVEDDGVTRVDQSQDALSAEFHAFPPHQGKRHLASPSGEHFALVTEGTSNPDSEELWLMAANQAPWQVLGTDAVYDNWRDLRFSNDEKSLYFSTTQGDVLEVVRVDLETRALESVHALPASGGSNEYLKILSAP